MDRRQWKQWILCGAIAVAAGCKTKQTSMMPTAAAKPNMLERTFTTKSQPAHKPTMPSTNFHESDDVKGPLKSTTVAALADLHVDAAFNNEELAPAERDRRLDEARQKFEKALAQEPTNLETLRGLGRLYTRLGDKARAADIYKSALAHHPKNHMLAHEAALSFGRFEEWPTSLGLWEHALSLDPASRKYPRMIGLAQARMGNYEGGFATLMKVCQEAEARTIMARELYDAGQADAAKQQAELAIKADPEYALAQQLMEQMGGVQAAGYQAK